MGHVAYFNHMIRLWKDEKIEEKTFIHYDNSENVNLDTFNYIMNIVKINVIIITMEKYIMINN